MTSTTQEQIKLKTAAEKQKELDEKVIQRESETIAIIKAVNDANRFPIRIRHLIDDETEKILKDVGYKVTFHETLRDGEFTLIHIKR
jgi:hypothetical protein